MMDQDPYAHEAREEELTEQKLLWRPMRTWYVNIKNNLSGKFGAFPQFWQDLANWQHWRSVRKEFLKFQDTGEWPSVQNEKSDDTKDEQISATTVIVPAVNEEVTKTKRKRSRFGDATGRKRAASGDQLVLASKLQLGLVKRHQEGISAAQAGILSIEQKQEVLLLQIKLRIVQEKCINFKNEFEKWLQDPKRPASPPPIYGPDGKRANTAQVRFKQMLDKERRELLTKLRSLQPEAAAALGDKQQKCSRKLYIPVKEFPNVGFMGLILGPRGNHHKRLENDSNCKISIRGRGSLREGSRGKDAQRDIEDDQDDLHVFIEGSNEEDVKKAVAMIEPLLQPESAHSQNLKEQHQLELAEINGTLRLDEYCHICGEKGHRQWECPAKQRSYAMANVRCALCGDTSHPTRDCALNKTDQTNKEQFCLDESRKKVDAQFLDFMNELGVDDSIGYQKSLHVTSTTSSSITTSTQVTVPQTSQQQSRASPRTWFSQTPQDAWNAAYLQQMATYNQYLRQYQQQPQQHHHQKASYLQSQQPYYPQQFQPAHNLPQQPVHQWPERVLSQQQWTQQQQVVPPGYQQQPRHIQQYAFSPPQASPFTSAPQQAPPPSGSSSS